MPYIHFTEQQKQQARQTDLCELLRSQGEQLKRSGSEFEWRNGSEKVTIRGNLWFHQYERVGGDAIDFVRRYYNKSYPEAMEYLLGSANGTLITANAVPRKKSDEPFELPPRNDNMRRVYAYLLTKRGIDKDVLNTFARHGMIYESADYHNAVFVGYDKNGVPRHASYRGTGTQSTFRGNKPSSMPEYSFHWNGKSDRLYLFEAPIDMLSYISMHKDDWQAYGFVVKQNCTLNIKENVTIEMNLPTRAAYQTLILNNGTVNMDGGKLIGYNTVIIASHYTASNNGIFNMNGGEISIDASSTGIQTAGNNNPTINLTKGSITGNGVAYQRMYGGVYNVGTDFVIADTCTISSKG